MLLLKNGRVFGNIFRMLSAMAISMQGNDMHYV